MKIKTNKKQFYIVLFAAFFVLLPVLASAQSFNYTPMENIPGFETETATGDFYSYIAAVYKFGIAAVGIAALFMLMLGGYMYLASAGNNASMEKAKGVITDAIVGLVLALTSYILLYIINPDLVRITPLPPAGAPPTITAPRPGRCQVVSSGSCSVSALQLSCFGQNAQKMSQVCRVESYGGNPNAESGSDKCKDGNSFSIGLFQINMFNSTRGLCDGSAIFEKTGSGPQGNCLRKNGSGACLQWDCTVKSTTLYNECKAKLKNSSTNIALACNLPTNGSNGNNLSPWAYTKNLCGL